MRIVDRGDEDEVSLCAVQVEGRLFGVETRRVREVLSRRPVKRVPLAPAFVGGIVSYRGDVLTAVCLRAVLGMPAAAAESCLLVIADEPETEQREEAERFGLMVDWVGSVVSVPRNSLAANPSTLDERSRTLFDGACRRPEGLLVRLDVARLRPERLAELQHESGWKERETPCGR